ncbi:hypothetical protein RR48_00356 [Papilio machaon]|uniref:Uncharacterized protein n=1 Tax=Papilio machaon TaxID=76193 RepID=A0A0N1PJA3_PAPMA|nr:hypothetical protein RR48_00356 [Papilio machaon]
MSIGVGSNSFKRSQHPRSLNPQDRSNSAPNVCINMVQRPITLAEHQRKNNQSNNSPQSNKYLTSGRHNKEDKDKGTDQQSHSTQVRLYQKVANEQTATWIRRNSEATVAHRHPQVQMRCLPLINGEGDAQKENISRSYASSPPPNPLPLPILS